jgi:membrane associated rhomboid family serine protease
MPRPTNRLSLLSRLTPVVTWFIGIFIALFLVFSLSGVQAKAFLIRWLALTPESLLGGEVWKLVTTTFLAGNALTFLLDVLVLWMFVPTLERAWGQKRFLTFFFLTSITGNLVAALFGLLLGPTPIIGMAPFLYAAIAAYGVQWGDAPVQFFGVIPMKAKVLAIGVTVIMLIATLLNREWALCLGYAAAIAAAVAYVGEPRLWLLRLRRFWLASQRKKLMKRYTVLPGGRAKSDKPDKKDDKSWLN